MGIIQPREFSIDVTDSYSIDVEDRADIVKILHVFLYDAGRVVHCCELTPSYDCRYLYTSIHFADHLYGVDDTRRGELEEKYAYEQVDDCYYHCCDLDRRADVVPLADREYADDGDDASEWDNRDGYDEVLEDVLEYAQGNWIVS